MADDFDAAGISWWSTARTAPSSSTTSSSFDGSSAIAAAASVSCSSAIADPVSIGHQSASGPLIDSSSLQISGYGMDWNQSLLRSSAATERAEPSFLQESFNYPSIDSGHHHQPHHIGSEQFLIDHQQQQQQQQQQQPALSMMLQGLFETPEAKPQQPIYNYQNPSSVAMTSHFLNSPSTKQQQQHQQQQLQFSNNAAFWNASVGAASDSGFYQLTLPVQFSTATAQSYEHKPSCSSLTTSKSNSDTVQKKSASSEPALKKPRIEAPSPLPTFKVRKEKLGDRITALQQLVSPFGKTDTASVLHEAIEYIKFLHDQVSVLSTPYLKNGHPMQHQQSSDRSKDGEGARQDLRSRGLCLVPIESTYPVASETTADFWTPTFGGTYR